MILGLFIFVTLLLLKVIIILGVFIETVRPENVRDSFRICKENLPVDNDGIFVCTDFETFTTLYIFTFLKVDFFT